LNVLYILQRSCRNHQIIQNISILIGIRLRTIDRKIINFILITVYIVSIICENVTIFWKIETFEHDFFSRSQKHLLIRYWVLYFRSILLLLMVLLNFLNNVVRFKIEKIEIIFVIWCTYLLCSFILLWFMPKWGGGLLHLSFHSHSLKLYRYCC
jgi:hypothetical protein